MATVNLLPRKEFEIVLNDGTVLAGKFNTWATSRFCQKRNITWERLVELMNMETLTKESANVGFDINVDMILCAVEYSFRKQKKEFPYTEVDAYDWVDELGGFMSDNVKALLKHAEGDPEEKKNQPEDQQPSVNSNVHIMLPEGHPKSSTTTPLTKSG